MSWEIFDVNCGFGGGEETKQFGPRNECGSSLYQVDTVACITNKGHANSSPSVKVNASNTHMGVAIQKNLLIFNETCSQHIFTFRSDAFIDVFSWSSDGDFLVFADRCGKLSLCHIESKNVLFSKSILQVEEKLRKPCIISVHFHKQFDDLYELIVITTDGMGFRFQNLNLKSLDEAVQKNNLEEAQKIQSQIKLLTFKLKDVHEEINSATYSAHDEENYFLLTGSGDVGISEWMMDTDEVFIKDIAKHPCPGTGFIKSLETPDGQYILALSTKKWLSLWSRFGFVFLSSWDQQVEDFVLFTTNAVHTDANGNSKSKEETKVVLLTVSDRNKKRQLTVLSLPEFELVYQLEISHCAALATMPSQQDTIVFIEGVSDVDDSSDDEYDDLSTKDNITTVRLRCLMEAIPQNRFSRLLHKKKFVEAEEFAKDFGLDVQLVYKVKSHNLLDRMSPWGREDQSSEVDYEVMITELKECLDKIEDTEHIVNCCLHAQLPTLKATSELFNYAREKVDFGSRKFTKSSNLLQELLDGINRLVTFEVAYGSHLFSGATWGSFLSSSLLDEVIKSFSETKINSGIIIWRRHQSEFDTCFTVNKLTEILQAIPKIIPSNKIVPWLRDDFVPYVLTVCPEGQCELADWLEVTARRLEFTEKDQWPDNALDMAEVMYTAFSSVTQSTQERGVASPMPFATKICKLSIPMFHFVDTEGDEKPPNDVSLSTAMQKLGNLVKSLRQVKTLHHEYNCKLSLAQFTLEDTKAIAFKLLDRIAAAELIPQTMKKYVKPYAVKNNLKFDEILFGYIQKIMEINKVLAVVWEPKVTSIIKEIEKKEQRSSATYQLMLKAQRPWSSEVESLVAAELKKNPENKKLHKQYQFAQLCKMTAGYGIRDTNLADLSGIEGVLKQMFSTDNPNALNDALKICQYFSSLSTSYVYSMRIKFWISSGKVSECCELMNSIDMTEAIMIMQYILLWVDCIISWEPVDEEDKLSQIQTTEGAFILLKHLTKLDKNFRFEKADILNKLKCISRLQYEFGVFISLTRYEEEDVRRDLLTCYYRNPEFFESRTKQLNKTETKKRETQSKINRLIRMSELLCFSLVELDEIIVNILHEENKLSEMFELTKRRLKALTEDKLQNISQKRLKVVWTVLRNLIVLNGTKCVTFDWVNNIDDMHEFASLSLSLCHEDKITDYITLVKILRFTSVIAAQCESTDYQEDTKKSGSLLYQWIEDQYQDDSLILPSTDVFPLLQRLFCLSLTSDTPENLSKYTSCRLTGRGVSYRVNSEGAYVLNSMEFSKVLQCLVKMLQDNNQQQLSIQAIMLGISTCAQHASNIQVGILPKVEHLNEIEKKELELMELDVQTSEMILIKGSQVIQEMCLNLARTVLCHRIIDSDISLSYLLVLPLEENKNLIRSLKSKFMSKYTRVQTVAKVGVSLSVLRCDSEFQKECKILSEGAYWGRKFQQLRVNLSSNLTYNLHDNKESIKTALNLLVQHPKIDLPSISSFCEAFGFDEETAILAFIGKQLIPPSKHVIKTDIDYQERIDEAIQALPPNNAKLINKLGEAVRRISPFDYDRLAFVFKKMTEIGETKTKKIAEENLTVLEMLALYERSSEVNAQNDQNILDDEDDEGWSSEIHQYPEEAKKRLPFHALFISSKKAKVLTAEMTSEKNVFKLKPILTKLDINKDQLFAVAIQKIAEKELALIKKSPSKMFDFSLVEKIFNEIDNHVIMMSTAKWLAKQLPKGASKAMVLKKLLERIDGFMDEDIDEEKTLIEVKKSYPRFLELFQFVSIESFLLEYGITDDRFFALCREPDQLIIKLYEEFGEKAAFETGRFTGVPDIPSLAKKIAEISKLSITRLISHMLQIWLPYKRCAGHDEEEAIDDDQRMSSRSNKEAIVKQNEKNLRRAIYTMASVFDKPIVSSLITSVYQSEEITNMCRIRALQVLFTLADEAYIKNVSGKEITEIRDKLVACIYLSELEKLHITHSEESFSKCNKESLVKGLWRNHNHEPAGVRLIADVCLDYKIYDPQLWNSLFLKLLTFDMIPYLTHVLVLLSGVGCLREIPSLVKMWKAIITAPFNSLSIPLSPEDERSCLHAAQLLTRCPVILDIGLPEIASLMKSAGLYTKALYCMMLIPDRTKRGNSIQAFIDDIGVETILALVKKSRDQGVMDPQLDGVEEEVFRFVEQHNLFIMLHGTQHFDRLVGYLVRSRKINNLLVKTLATGRLNNALELVGFYIKEHPNSSTARMLSNTEDMDMKDALLIYLQNENLLGEVKPFLGHLLKNPVDESMANSNTSMTSPIMSSTFSE